MLRGKKVLICDLDGTLLDSLRVWDSVDTALMEALGGVPDGEAVGRRREAILREMRAERNPYLAYCRAMGALCGSELPAEEVLALRDRISCRKLAEEVRYRPGAAEAMRYVMGLGLTIGVATTTRRRNMEIYRKENEGIRRELPLDEFMAFLYTREDVSAIKPSPEVHERILADLGLRREDCLIMEDSLSGVMAASNAGIDVAALYEPYSEADWGEITRLARWHFSDWAAWLAAVQSELA